MAKHAEWRREWGLLLAVALLALPLFTPRLYSSDEIKYLAPLHSIYFDADLHYANEYGHFVELDPDRYDWLRTYRDQATSTGRRLNDAAIGSALLWAPFYLAADVAVAVVNRFGGSVERDGFSPPYVWAICLGSLFWGTLGLLLVYLFCRDHFGRWASQRAVLGLWLASPLVFYLYITPPMAHANSFFATTLFLLVWYRSRGERSLRQWMSLAACAGLMVLVRELNWLFLAPLAAEEGWTLGARSSGRLLSKSRPRRSEMIRSRLSGYVVFVVLFAVVIAPQFLVYRSLHGTLEPTPYVVSKMSLFPRHDFDVLFSGFHGLFSWSPITLLGVIGLGFLARRQPLVAGGLALTFMLQVVVIGSFDTWWGGASFGARRFINCTAVFALGLGALLERVAPRRRWVASTLLIVLVGWNIGLAIQYSTGIIPRDQPVSMRRLATNQFTEVLPRLADITKRFLLDRSFFYERQ